MASIVVVDGGSSFGAELVGRLFGAGRDVLVAPTVDVALERIERFPPEVVFVLHEPPDHEGTAIARAVRAADADLLVIVGGRCAPLDPIPGVQTMCSPSLSATHVARALMVAADERTQRDPEALVPTGDLAPRTAVPTPLDDPDVELLPRAVSVAGAPRWAPGQFDRIAASDWFDAPSASPLDASFFRGAGVGEIGDDVAYDAPTSGRDRSAAHDGPGAPSDFEAPSSVVGSSFGESSDVEPPLGGSSAGAASSSDVASPSGGTYVGAASSDVSSPRGGSVGAASSPDVASPRGGASDGAPPADVVSVRGGSSEFAFSSDVATPLGGSSHGASSASVSARGGSSEFASSADVASARGGSSDAASSSDVASPLGGSSDGASPRGGSSDVAPSSDVRRASDRGAPVSDAPDDDGASPRGAATQDTVAPAPAVDHDALCGALVSELAGVTAAALVDLSIAAQVGRHALDADAHAALDALTSIVVEFFDGATLATFEDRVGEDAVYAIVLSTAVAHRVLRGFGDRYVVALVVPTTHPLDPVRHRLEALLPGLAANLT